MPDLMADERSGIPSGRVRLAGAFAVRTSRSLAMLKEMRTPGRSRTDKWSLLRRLPLPLGYGGRCGLDFKVADDRRPRVFVEHGAHVRESAGRRAVFRCRDRSPEPAAVSGDAGVQCLSAVAALTGPRVAAVARGAVLQGRTPVRGVRPNRHE